VSRTERSGDLRERMQRVAAKPQQTRRRSSVVSEPPPPKPLARRASRTRPVAAVVAEEIGVRELRQPRPSQAVGRPRSETALAWALWELTTVPTRRWQWFKQFARGRDPGSLSEDEGASLQRGDDGSFDAG
jgi:hypothetical protein